MTIKIFIPDLGALVKSMPAPEPTGYTDPTGMTFQEMLDHLTKIKLEHYSAPKGEEDQYSYETFDEMVQLFADDDFFKDHRVAIAYLDMKTWCET